MSRHITILGFGPVGQSVAERLLASGDEVTVAQFHRGAGSHLVACPAHQLASRFRVVLNSIGLS